MKYANIAATGSMNLIFDSYQEQLAYILCGTLENVAAQGMKISQPEEVDFSNVEADLQAFVSYTKSWYDSNVEASASGGEITAFDKNYLPDIALFIFLLATGQWGAIFVLFVKVGLEYLLDTTEKGLDPNVATGDSAEVLKQIFAVLDPSTGEIVGSKVDGLSQLKIKINNVLSQAEESALYEVQSMADDV